MLEYLMNNRQLRWAAGRLVTILLAALTGSMLATGLEAGELAVDLRVVDEVAPPGGLAVVRVELTEPKPISRGRIRLRQTGSPLGDVVGVAVVDAIGDVSSTVITTSDGVVVEFESSGATLGTHPELPIFLVAIEVRPTAVLGHQVPLELDLSGSNFVDPSGLPYPEETKPGTFTVGGLSVNNMDPLIGQLPAGSVLRIHGVNFDSEVDVNISGANLGEVRVVDSRLIEATLASPFGLQPTTRVRLRNPNDDEDFFYPAALLDTPAGGNAIPLAVADEATTPEDTPLEIDVLFNDSDADGDPLTITAAGPAANGEVQIAAGKIFYSPALDFNGIDSIPYEISDGRGGVASASVTVTVTPVEDPPMAIDDAVQTAFDTALTFDPLGNDRDPDGGNLSLLSIEQPPSGEVLALGDGTVVYVPHPLFSGTETFHYTISNTMGSTSVATVEVEVLPSNDPPRAADDIGVTRVGIPIVLSLLENDFRPGHRVLRFQLEGPPPPGTIEDSGNGPLYTPDVSVAGVLNFSYSLTDLSGRSSSAQVLVVVNESNPSHFDPDTLDLPAGSTADVAFHLPADLAGTTAQLESTPAGVLQHPATIELPQPAQTAQNAAEELVSSFRLSALEGGTAVLRLTAGQEVIALPVSSRVGRVSALAVVGREERLVAGVGLSNPSSAPIEVRIRGLHSNEDLQLPPPPIQIHLPLGPGTQTARLLRDLDDGFIGFKGWVEISSSPRQAAPLLLHFDSSLRGYAAASATPRFTDLVIPAIPREEEIWTLSLVNNNPFTANVTLTWQGPDGPVEAPPIVLSSLASDTFELDSLFPIAAAPGSIHLASDQELNVYLQVSHPRYLYGQTPIGAAPKDTLSVTQAVVGRGWITRLLLTNPTTEARAVELRWVPDDSSTLLESEVSLAPGSTRTLDPSSIFELSEDRVQAGSLLVSNVAGLAGMAFLGRTQEPVLATSIPLLNTLCNEVLLPQAVSGVVAGEPLLTGIAALNPGALDAVVTVDLYSPAGELLGHANFLLQSMSRGDRLLQELFQLQLPLKAGYLRVRSTRPAAMVGMFGSTRLRFLSTVEATPAIP